MCRPGDEEQNLHWDCALTNLTLMFTTKDSSLELVVDAARLNSQIQPVRDRGRIVVMTSLCRSRAT